MLAPLLCSLLLLVSGFRSFVSLPFKGDWLFVSLFSLLDFTRSECHRVGLAVT